MNIWVSNINKTIQEYSSKFECSPVLTNRKISQLVKLQTSQIRLPFFPSSTPSSKSIIKAHLIKMTFFLPDNKHVLPFTVVNLLETTTLELSYKPKDIFNVSKYKNRSTVS